MAELYADQDFDDRVSEELRRLGHDVVSAFQVGRSDDPDPDALAYATLIGRPILTFNRWHFERLHRRYGKHAGIVSCKRDENWSALAARIHAAIIALGNMAGQHIRVNRLP